MTARPDFIQAPTLTTAQLTALSALIVTNEKMVTTGELSLERSVTLRWLLAQTLSAFRLPAVYEREGHDDTAEQAAVREEMGHV